MIPENKRGESQKKFLLMAEREKMNQQNRRRKMNLLNLKSTFLSLPLEEKRTLLEKIRASRFVMKRVVRSSSPKKEKRMVKRRKDADLSALSTTELEALIAQLKGEMEELETEEEIEEDEGE